MHFMAMLGFTVTNTRILYDVPITVASAVIAVIVVFIGLLIAGTGGRGPVRIAFGGLFTGVGVAAMHYTGMFAMRLDGKLHYDPGLVAASVLIAVVAATVALWFTVTLSRRSVIFGAALVMGVAVNGMHFTGMASLSVQASQQTSEIEGATALSLLVPIGLLVLLVIGGLIFAIGAAPSEEDFAGRAYLEARQAQREKLQSATSTSASTKRRTGPAQFQRSASPTNSSGSFNGFGSNGSKSAGSGTSDATRTTSGATNK
jgi:NO-binding membrane sensor protein with MHYT domain